jgi:hypothetical protein
VLTKEEHAALLRSFVVDQFLQLVTLEAKRLHDGHVTIFALTTHYQVAFGPPHPVSRLCWWRVCPTRREARLSHAPQRGPDYGDGRGERRR